MKDKIQTKDKIDSQQIFFSVFKSLLIDVNMRKCLELIAKVNMVYASDHRTGRNSFFQIENSKSIKAMTMTLGG